MALRLRRDVQKASYYVWFLGAEEAKGLRGARVINSVLPYLIDRSRGQEPLKVTLQVSHKGIKIVQGSSKHLIPHSAITSSVQTDDIVACVLLLYNPATKCPLHVHAYRCDSESTAEALHLQLQILINRPDNQKRFEELETRLGILPPLASKASASSQSAIHSKPHVGDHAPVTKSNSAATSSSHHRQQSQHYPAHGAHSAPHHRRHESSPKRFSSSLGSDTGNSTRESECSEEHVGAGGASPISHSPPINGADKTVGGGSIQYPHHQPLSVQQNNELFDSLAAELRAKLNGNGPPLLLPPRDYDTVHRSKGNLTAIELRRCRNALIVGGALPPTTERTTAGERATTTGVGGAPVNGKQVSSRGSSGIGSDLAPSPERPDLNSSSDDEHWSNEADNSVIALKPSQISLMERTTPMIPHHAVLNRKSAVQPPEDSYLRDLPSKPYMQRQSERAEREREPRTKTPSSWSREDDIKPIIMRPADYDAKFNRLLHAEQKPSQHVDYHSNKHTKSMEQQQSSKLHETEKFNEINRLLSKKLSHERERERENDSPERYKQRYVSNNNNKSNTKHKSSHIVDDDFAHLEEYDDSDPSSDQLPPVPPHAPGSSSYRKENLTDKQKFIEYTNKKQQQQKQQLKSYAAEEAQRYGAGSSRHRYIDPADLPFDQTSPTSAGGAAHNKYAAVHRGMQTVVSHSPERIDSAVGHRTSERHERRERHDRPKRERSTSHLDESPSQHHSRERERERERVPYASRSKEPNPYRQPESLPYIQSMEKMMKSSAMRYKSFDGVEHAPYVEERKTVATGGHSRKQSSGGSSRHEVDYPREYAPSTGSNISPRDRFKDAKDKFRAMERSGSRFDLTDERDASSGDYKPPARRRGSIERGETGRIVYQDWSDEDADDVEDDMDDIDAEARLRHRMRPRSRSHDVWAEDDRRHDFNHREPPVESRKKSRDRREHSRDSYIQTHHEPPPSLQSYERTTSSRTQRGERERERERECEPRSMRDRSREFAARRDYSPPPEVETTRTLEKSIASQRHHPNDMYPPPTPTPSSNAGGKSSPNAQKHLSNMPKGYRHSYAEPVFARSGGRVGLAAVNPY